MHLQGPERNIVKGQCDVLQLPHCQGEMLTSYWCINEVQQVLLTMVAVKERGCLGLHSYPPLSLHLKFVQHLFVLVSLCYSTYG